MAAVDEARRPGQPDRHRARVAAILVVHNGEEWLPEVLRAISRQTHRPLDLVAVDNGSRDGSAQILTRHLRPGQLITRPRNLGFTRAVRAALEHPVVVDADAVLLVHDDLALADDTVDRLVGAPRADPELGIVGPKLRQWNSERRLQSVGLTIDRYGGADTLIEADEYDQGQHDGRWETLYVSTAGMLVRRDVLVSVGFDPRFPDHGDDLDLCWRAWIRGHRVAVVPQAVGYHVQAGSRPAGAIRRHRAEQWRYFAERHSVATVCKNHEAPGLVGVLPVMALVALARIVGLVVTRRFAAAGAVARAHLWNLWQLPATLRARREVRAGRVRRDHDLAHLFAPALPHARRTVTAAGDWLAGGRGAAGPPEQVPERPGRRGAATLAGLTALAVYTVGMLPLLGPGQLLGGEVAPWPASARAFLDAFTAPWGEAAAASGVLPSPALGLLGITSLLGFGNAWAAQRLLVLGLLPLAWLLAMRAGRLVTARPGPRAIGASCYVLAPATWAPLAAGHYGALVAAALLPGVALVGARAADARAPPGSAWRGAALLAVGLAALTAFAPQLWPLVIAGWAALWPARYADVAGSRRSASRAPGSPQPRCSLRGSSNGSAQAGPCRRPARRSPTAWPSSCPCGGRSSLRPRWCRGSAARPACWWPASPVACSSQLWSSASARAR